MYWDNFELRIKNRIKDYNKMVDKIYSQIPEKNAFKMASEDPQKILLKSTKHKIVRIL